MKRKLLIAAGGITGGLFLFAGPAAADAHDGDAAGPANRNKPPVIPPAAIKSLRFIIFLP